MNRRPDNSVLIYDIEAAIDSMKQCIDPKGTCENCICRPCNERCTEMLMRIVVDYYEKTPCRKPENKGILNRIKEKIKKR